MELKKIRFVTLYTGENGSEACVCNCPCCSQAKKKGSQGTLDQVRKLLEKLPNLEKLYILGNPDPAVDTRFCNQVARMTVAGGIKVAFCTSGAGGRGVLQRLLEGLSPEMVTYVGFSIDSLSKERMSILKGIKYPFERAIEGIEWAIGNGYEVKIQPTLWPLNYQEAGELIEFFVALGVKRFHFHVGSVENGQKMPTHRHLTEEELRWVHFEVEEKMKKYPYLKMKVPVIFPSIGEYDENKYFCMHTERCCELLVSLGEKGIWCTHTPIASEFSDAFGFFLEDAEKVELKKIKNGTICPFSKQLTGGMYEKTLCRYVSRTWDY